MLGKPIPGVRERLQPACRCSTSPGSRTSLERPSPGTGHAAAWRPAPSRWKATTASPGPCVSSPAPRRLQILFLYSRPPLPMTRGDELTVSHLLEFLHSRGHQVDFVTLIEAGHTMRPEHEAWLRSRCRTVELIPHSLKRSAPRAVRAGSPAGRSRSASCSAQPSWPGSGHWWRPTATTWPTPIISARPRPCARLTARSHAHRLHGAASCRRR